VASLQVTIVSLALLMALVVLCTLAQTELGTLGSVNTYMRSMVVVRHFSFLPFAVPVFPGGALVGLVLLVNLTVALVKRFEFGWAKAGLWLVHFGLIILVAGEFVSGTFQVETNMSVEVGQTVNFVESARQQELAITDLSAGHEEAFAIPQPLLKKGGSIPLPGTPLTFVVKKYFLNADLAPRTPSDPPTLANMGVGAGVKVTEAEPVTVENEMNRTSAFVEVLADGHSYGTWLVSNALGAPQSFIHAGHTYFLSMRFRRYYLPYAITLKKFSHDVYPGTQIPKNFSSLVHISNPAKGEERDVLIYMNQPLRYEGRTFYQASFGKGDTLSILNVVSNPGWLLPYISCVLITLGLLVHFGITLRRSIRRRQDHQEAL
jgi:hypothetical protein